VPNRMVVRGEARMALRVVAHMNEQLARLFRHADAVEERCGSRALLVHRNRRLRSAVGISDRVRAAFGDPGEERPGSDSPLDAAVEIEAISGDSAQSL
jgi:hypothetical protein